MKNTPSDLRFGLTLFEREDIRGSIFHISMMRLKLCFRYELACALIGTHHRDLRTGALRPKDPRQPSETILKKLVLDPPPLSTRPSSALRLTLNPNQLVACAPPRVFA